MNDIAALVTSEARREHAAFWTTVFGRIDGDFRLRQNWQSYALPFGPAPHYDFAVGTEAEQFLRNASPDNDLGIFVILLAAIFQLLRKYSGSEMVFVDSPFLLSAPKYEYGGHVPLVGSADCDLTVRDYLRSVREIVAQSYSYQDFPIGEFAEIILKRRPRPVTNMLVQFEGVHEPSAQLDAYDFTIVIAHRAGLEIRLQANPDAFTLHYLQHFSRHLCNVIAAYRNLDLPLDRVRFTDEAEKQRLAFPADSRRLDGTVLDVFAERVAASPSSVALSTDDTEITYADLDYRSTTLAHLMRTEYGIVRGDTVGMLCNRSIDWVIGILGVLKAGGVYVPLDPQYPEARLRFMIEDAQIRALLVHSEYLPMLTEFWEIPMVALDFQLSADMPSTAPLTPSVQSDDPAYIIYTSGSTGTPKGVVLGHRSLLNMALYHIDAFGFTVCDRMVQFYSPSFDGSIMEVFVTLLAGGRLALARPELVRDPELFSAFIRRQAVTTVNATPMYLKALDWDALDTVRRVISAGDAAIVENLRLLAQARSVHNSYGPTEGTVCVTDYVVDPKLRYAARIPIGKPIRNVRIYLLDEHLDLVPEGCVGEICISGIALALKYLNREDLTAAAFVAHPFEPGERLYRTGDLGVWLPDGNLELVGRKDTQVKVRGYRIELAEIEAVLMQHAAVSEAVVTVREDRTGGKQLFACVAPKQVSAEQLWQYLNTRFPEFMVPAGFAILDHMPLTPNGKVDRTALALLSPETADRSSHVEPRTARERRLAQIWFEVLGIGTIGIHDNFFELGGDSILILQIVSRAQQSGIKITAQQLFEHPTIEGLARVATDSSSTTAEQGPLTGPVSLTPAQRWFFSQQLEDPHHYNQSAMIEVPAELQPAVIERALARVIEHHDVLRLAFFPTADGGWEQLYAAPPLVAPVGVTNAAGIPAAAREAVMTAEASRLQASFRLSQPPLLRAHLFRLGDDRPSRLLFVLHHLITDGVSWRILLEDMFTACRQLDANQPVQLPTKMTALRDWVRCLTELSRTEFAGLDHWHATADQARGMCATLPVDGPFAARSTSLVLTIDRAQTNALLDRVAKPLTARVDEILLTALLATIRDWTGQAAVLVNLEGHGRDEIFPDVDISRTIGWFTALYPVVLQGASDAELGVLLESVIQRLRSVPANRLGYGMARYLREDPEVVGMPPAPILFNYLGQIDRVLPDSSWKPLLHDNGPERSPGAEGAHLLEIEGMVFEGQLHLRWVWDLGIFTASTIERVAQWYKDNLLGLVQLSRGSEIQRFTSSDFPAARIDQKSLDALVARIRS